MPRATAWAWLAAQFEAERERWSLWLPVGLGCGIALYFALPVEPPLWLGAAAVLWAALPALGWRRGQAFLVVALAAGSVAAGFTLAQWRTQMVAAPVLQDEVGPTRVAGEVLSVEPTADGEGGGARVVLQQPEIAGLAPEATPAQVRLRLTMRDPVVLQPGERIALRAVLRPPPEPAAPGAFDFARRAYFQRLGGVGYAVGHAEVLPPPATSPAAADAFWHGWRLWWAELRLHVAQRVLRSLPGEEGAVAAALMTGERAAIPPEVIAAMRDSGLAHLLAISGLHLGLVAGLLFFAVRALLALVPRLALEQPIKKWAALAAGLGAFAYLMLVGATVPTQRAFVMIGLVLLAVMADRTAISLRLVAWAAAVVLLVAPESLLGASFQMSFAAVIALVAAYEALSQAGGRAWIQAKPLALRLPAYLGGVALTSVIAILATAPFAISNFNRLAWYGLAANLAAVPLTAFWIMPCALIAFCLMPFGLESLALVPMGWGIAALIAVAKTVAGWSGAVTLVPAMPMAGLALVVLGGLWLCLWRRAWRLAGLVGIAAGLGSIWLSPPPDLLVSGDARLLALRGADGRLWLSTKRAARFTADVWQRRVGAATTESWPRAGTAAEGALTCDPLGCMVSLRGQRVALVRDGRALAEDCRLADVVISLEPVARRDCAKPRVLIDRFDIWRQGGHALWLEEAGVRVESVAARRGERPWVRRRGRDWD